MRYEIEGGSLRAAVLSLESGETIISEVGGRTWAKGNVTKETKAPGGLGKSIGRMFSGESLFIPQTVRQRLALHHHLREV